MGANTDPLHNSHTPNQIQHIQWKTNFCFENSMLENRTHQNIVKDALFSFKNIILWKIFLFQKFLKII